MGSDAIELIHELVKALLLGQEIARRGPSAAFFKVRCMRSWRSFFRGQPRWIRSGIMPIIH